MNLIIFMQLRFSVKSILTQLSIFDIFRCPEVILQFAIVHPVHQNENSKSLKLSKRKFLRLQICQKLLSHYKIFLKFSCEV